MRVIAGSVLDLIGNTPMVRINRLTDEDDAMVLAKLERFNPGGSVKDRIAKYMVEQLERQGKLTREKTILEATSGNTGVGLAMVAAVKGYKAVLVMPEDVTYERVVQIKAYGAEVILTPKENGEAGAIEYALRMFRENPEKYIMLDQFNNPLNPLAHYETTGREIIEQTEGRIDMFIAGIGTAGTLVGVGRRLKEFNPKIKVVAVEPPLGENIPGLRNMKEPHPPSILDETVIDEKVAVTLEEAIAMMKNLARIEGLFVGVSSGASMHVAIEKARKLGKGKTIVTILPDLGERYISKNYFP
ncbi:MAG TPA: cysteine synthase family protein [Candidatus Bathyarchaeota archaeon]|nr:cysteine synthase family protein [Candidatus Bathyarchaeota archaeon]